MTSRLLVLCAAVSCAGGVALADTRRAHDDDAEALARVCLSEAGWTPGQDCAGILAVLRSRSERTGIDSINAMARVYSRRVFDRARADRRKWIAYVADTDATPKGWPSQLDWRDYRPRWQTLVNHAAELLAMPNACEANHWGGPMDDHRALRAGWTRVDCGNTRNHFWSTRRNGQ